MANVREISDSSFEADVLKSDLPVLVDFWAPWCGPCKAIAPVVEEISGSFNGKANVFKMNVDDNPETPGKLGIRSIPTLKVFKSGAEVEQLIGAASKEAIEGILNPHIG